MTNHCEGFLFTVSSFSFCEPSCNVITLSFMKALNLQASSSQIIYVHNNFLLNSIYWLCGFNFSISGFLTNINKFWQFWVGQNSNLPIFWFSQYNLPIKCSISILFLTKLLLLSGKPQLFLLPVYRAHFSFLTSQQAPGYTSQAISLLSLLFLMLQIIASSTQWNPCALFTCYLSSMWSEKWPQATSWIFVSKYTLYTFSEW